MLGDTLVLAPTLQGLQGRIFGENLQQEIYETDFRENGLRDGIYDGTEFKEGVGPPGDGLAPLQPAPLDLILSNVFQSILSSVLIAVGYALYTLGVVNAVYPLPGNTNGGLWPLYVADHASPQTSQNLLDPYSFHHASHGVLIYILGSWAGVDLGGGLVMSLVSAMLWEMLENTNLVILLFRENSGTSQEYAGDSRVNVIGDVLCCAVGYALAHVGHEFAGPWFPFAWIVASEIVLAATIRDNVLLMALQLIAPSDIIKQWQAEIIHKEGGGRGDTGAGFGESGAGFGEFGAGYWDNRRLSTKYQNKVTFQNTSSSASDDAF